MNRFDSTGPKPAPTTVTLFDGNLKFWIMMVLLEWSSSDISKYTLFKIQKTFFHLYNFFLRDTTTFQSICKFLWLYQKKKRIKIYQTTTSFYSIKRFKVNKKQIFSGEKKEKFRWLYTWLCSLVLRRGFLVQYVILVYSLIMSERNERSSY